MATRNNHIVFLHSRCKRSYQDLYIADMILVLLRSEIKVTVCTTEMDVKSPILNVEDVHRNLYFFSSSKHLPDSLFGYLKRFCTLLKLIWLIFSLILRPPAPRPRLIITDMNSVAVKLLKVFTSCKILYVKHFSNLDFGDKFHSPLAIISSLTLNSSISSADEIIVHTECLKNILQGYIPKINNTISVLNPCYDTGFWLQEPLDDVQSIVPMLPKIYFMFVVFSDFEVTSNLGSVLKAMDYIVRFTHITFSIKVHLVIAGYLKPLSSKENKYFQKLKETTATKVYGDNITFLKQTTIIQQKTLIKNCTAVISPKHHNVFPGSILMAMNMKKPIVSVHSGFARQVLVNGVTGFLLYDFPSIFATKMEELARTPQVGEQVVENAKREFDRNYSFHAYSRKLNQIIDNHLNS